MDNLAHSLVGAALAEAGLKKKTPLATATLIIGANFPDVDAVAMVIGSDFSLWFRRGWTHGVLAWVVLPPILAMLMLGWDKWIRRRRNPDAEPVHVGWLVGLSYLGVLTHPFLDWLNTYGVRLLMPFDGQWFYGDSLFIVDPWLWLLCASAVVLARSQSKLSIAAWGVLGAATSAMIFGYGGIPVLVKVVWGLGVGTIVAMRVAGWLEDRTRQLAAVALGLASLYIAAMVSGTVYTRSLATDAFAERGVEVDQILSGPVPGNPLVREGLVRGGGEYRYFQIDPLADTTFVEPQPGVPVEEPGPVVKAALAAPEVRGFRNWMRFPSWEVEKLDDGWRVILRDLRYAEPDEYEEGFGVAIVELDEELNPRLSEKAP
ncbi:metal-dependent hydrolase [Persicimonas caeni]|uniref:Metal-dependent hydrolase n=1 Tax=Persicimonas caeni TaxID=2292766 RepID=A0A4Y6PQ52_PERCE|nr:metal-dependent hydrolase [Persicimonas caeni]QDG50454.1 metal-dependent hydrolase [Persicimonas caeni]QED31675.1 metal-dependent hydrolase [Persicimonas caeni]